MVGVRIVEANHFVLEVFACEQATMPSVIAVDFSVASSITARTEEDETRKV